MRTIWSLILVISLLGICLAGSQRYWRIKVEDKSELVRLYQLGAEFLDVKVYPTHHDLPRFKWIADNGFVTVKADAAIQSELVEAGFEIVKVGEYSDDPDNFLSTKNVPFQLGWPKTMAGWPGVYGQHTTIADVDQNGKMEIFLNNIEGYVYAWRHNGTYLPSYPKNPYLRFLGINSQGDSVFTSWLTTGSPEGGAIGDLDQDGFGEFVFGKDIGFIFSHGVYPHSLPAFPMDIGIGMFTNTPAMADIDNDGVDELVMFSYMDDSNYPNQPGQLAVYDGDGTVLPGWPVTIPVESESSPVVGDIDNDGFLEIVVGSGKNTTAGIPGQLFAFNHDGTICSGFPIEVGNSVESTASLADINLDGYLEILIRIKPTSTNINGIYAYDGFGRPISGFPAVLTNGGSTGAPAIADADGDGLPDIAYGTVMAVDSGMVWLFDSYGNLKPGFPRPVNRTFVEESVALADVSGDSLPDIVATTNGTSNKPGLVWAFDYQGQTVSGYPIQTPNVIGSSLESAPSVIDVDGDGDNEIFTANWNGDVFAWDTPGISNPQNDWPTYKYDARRSGNKMYGITNLKTAPEVVAADFRLSQNYPNPFNPETTIEFTLNRAGEVTLSVYNITGQLVQKIVNGQKLQSGRHQYRFNGSGLASGIYFYRLSTPWGSRQAKMILMK
ncbi:MAG: hypothetical protein Kow0037_07630 [Calditrichia bacterium]